MRVRHVQEAADELSVLSSFLLVSCFCLIWFGLSRVRRHGAICGSSRPRGFVLFGFVSWRCFVERKAVVMKLKLKLTCLLFKASAVPRCFLLCCIGFSPLANSSTFLYESIDEGMLWRSSSSCICRWVCLCQVLVSRFPLVPLVGTSTFRKHCMCPWPNSSDNCHAMMPKRRKAYLQADFVVKYQLKVAMLDTTFVCR